MNAGKETLFSDISQSFDKTNLTFFGHNIGL